MAGPLADRLRAALERRLLALWFGDPRRGGNRLLAATLSPLAAIVAWASSRRRARTGHRATAQRPSVVVVGNLVVGGTGKTPAVIALARAMHARGWRVGVLAGGYRGACRDARLVASGDDADRHGDEAVLLADATGLPVAAGRRRAEALSLLEARHPDLDLVISDDGLQHADLPRTIEIALFDSRGAGNGRLLPAGPLREPLRHAAAMDALLVNASPRARGERTVLPPDVPSAVPALAQLPVFGFTVEPTTFRRVAGVTRSGYGPPAPAQLPPEEFARLAAGQEVDAVAGIARPARFFDALRAMGLAIVEHPLPDHARIEPAMLSAMRAPVIVMTEKDAVKCRGFADDRCWALEVRARIEPAFVDWLEERLRGPTTA